MSREIMQQALDLLKSAHVSTALIWERHDCVNALEQELAKPEQEPVALKMVYGEVCCQSKHDDQSNGMWCPITEEEFPNGTPFYTAPPRKPWVGLTDDEIWKCQKPGLSGDVYKLIEAKLREKNT